MPNQTNLVKCLLTYPKICDYVFYLNSLSPNWHRREEQVHRASDILDMTFLSPGLSSRDISFSIADDHIDSEHCPFQISIDQAIQTKHTTCETTLPIWQNWQWFISQHTKDNLNSIALTWLHKTNLKEEKKVYTRGGIWIRPVGLCRRSDLVFWNW